MIIDFINNLKPLPGFTNVDVRMYCVLHTKNGRHDTLRVGSPHIYKINDKVYDQDSSFIGLLKRLTEEQ